MMISKYKVLKLSLILSLQHILSIQNHHYKDVMLTPLTRI